MVKYDLLVYLGFIPVFATIIVAAISESSNINSCAAISRKLLRDGRPTSHSNAETFWILPC